MAYSCSKSMSMEDTYRLGKKADGYLSIIRQQLCETIFTHHKHLTMDVDPAFTRALPKAELHAHLTGSISRKILHDIWQQRKSTGITLEDPAIALKPAGTFPTIHSFFQIFHDYIYNLVNDAESIAYATRSVAEDFRRDGVRYLELRTTPRQTPDISREHYVEIVLSALREYHEHQATSGIDESHRIEVHLILSVDRTMTAEQADEIVSIAEKHKPDLSSSSPSSTTIPPPSVLGLDLCGNPAKGNVSTFTPAFQRARALGFDLTVHFAEIPASSTERELETLLSWKPSRLGHAIHIPPHLKEVIKQRELGLELCLSCNILAGMTEGGFRGHHFGEWMATGCAVALGTDDVGIFESSLSNEYFIVAREFGLSRREVIALTERAVGAAFAGKERMRRLLA